MKFNVLLFFWKLLNEIWVHKCLEKLELFRIPYLQGKNGTLLLRLHYTFMCFSPDGISRTMIVRQLIFTVDLFLLPLCMLRDPLCVVRSTLGRFLVWTQYFARFFIKNRYLVYESTSKKIRLICTYHK